MPFLTKYAYEIHSEGQIIFLSGHGSSGKGASDDLYELASREVD